MLVWVGGAVVLLVAGAATALVPWLLARQRERRVAWSTARAAIDSATVSRDAAPHRVPEAEQLLTRAELLAAGGPAAARSAAAYAQQADALWREVTGG